MDPIALTRASQFMHVTETLEHLGEEPERLLEQANMPMWHFCDPDDLVPTHHIHRLMDQAARSLGARTFGLMVGAQNSFGTLGAYGKLVANAPTPYHSFKTSSRLLPLHTSGARNSMTEVGDEVWLCRSRFRGPEVGRREMEHYVLMRLIEHVGRAAGPSWRPAKVCLQAREAPDPKLRDALADPEIRIGQEVTGIAVPRGLLAQPTRRQGGMPDTITDAEERRLRDTAPGSSFVDTLRQLTETLLKEEPPRIETMAAIAGLSVRSLQRRLAKNGLSHSEIVDQARYKAATRLLEGGDQRITDIGMELGYADSAHFTRAFKRWTRVSPRQYRDQQRMHSRVLREAA